MEPARLRSLLCLVALCALGCRGAPSDKAPIHPIRNMFQQPRYNAQSSSAFFPDGRTMRPPVVGTVAQEMELDPMIETGWSDEQQSWALTIPDPVVQTHHGMQSLIERGQERYGIFCAPCHGLSGEGDGMVSKRAAGGLAPPTFHNDRIRHLPDGQVFATITYGVRNMPSYRHSIPNADRWAIVGYLRALQMTLAQPQQAANEVR